MPSCPVNTNFQANLTTNFTCSVSGRRPGTHMHCEPVDWPRMHAARMRASLCWLLGLCAVVPCRGKWLSHALEQRQHSSTGYVRPCMAARGGQRLGVRLRGGGATSGIWETFNRMKAEGPHRLHEVKAQPFNELSIRVHRCNDDEGFHMAVMCQARPFKGEQVEMTGVWTAPLETPAPSREVSVELELDPTCPAEGRGASTWRAVTKLPPGHLTYRYRIKRGTEIDEETVTRTVEIFTRPQTQSVMLATDLDGTMLGDPAKIEGEGRSEGRVRGV